MEVFIESPAAQDQLRENILSKIWQSDTTTFFSDRGELFYETNYFKLVC